MAIRADVEMYGRTLYNAYLMVHEVSILKNQALETIQGPMVNTLEFIVYGKVFPNRADRDRDLNMSIFHSYSYFQPVEGEYPVITAYRHIKENGLIGMNIDFDSMVDEI